MNCATEFPSFGCSGGCDSRNAVHLCVERRGVREAAALQFGRKFQLVSRLSRRARGRTERVFFGQETFTSCGGWVKAGGYGGCGGGHCEKV